MIILHMFVTYTYYFHSQPATSAPCPRSLPVMHGLREKAVLLQYSILVISCYTIFYYIVLHYIVLSHIMRYTIILYHTVLYIT